ncbi:tetratricopeptide repeat protein [Thermus neutrinimicus]|uniref:tetratricopeptide repeat protein n=1 Tax=Thermus neutrinimicus TaxID=2908149 RepID=UPI001FAA743D|nr:tetratricopeptide repeat protein [Thermus neutrinimicus]
MRLILGLLLLGLPAWAQGAEDYFTRCQRLFQQGALESAQATCELALTSDPEHRPSLLLLARIHLERGDLAQAESYLAQLGDEPEAQLLRARLLLQKGQAAEVLRLSLPPGPEANLLRAMALEALHQYEEALRLAQGLPSTPEARLLLSRLHLALGRPQEGLAFLGSTLRERLERGRLLFLSGRPQEAIPLLEGLLPELSAQPGLQSQALSLLALAYFGQGQLAQGQAALRQLSALENLPARLLAQAWPWLIVLLAFLLLVLLGESRIELLRALEVVEDPLPGPGSLYLTLLGSLLLSLLLAALLGKALFANALALFTPYQKDLLLPNLYLIYGLLLFASVLLARGFRKRLPNLLGSWSTWIEGFWVGPALVLLLFLYGWIREALGLGTLPLNLLAFLGLALMEPFFRGLVPLVLKERYKDLHPYLAALLFALAVPGPTFLLLLLGAGLLWAKERAEGTLGLALGWVVAGVILALLPTTWLRSF